MPRKILRWICIVFGSLFAIILLAVIGVYVVSSLRMNKSYSIATEPLTTAISSGDIERGRHLVAAIGQCSECHGKNLSGNIMIDDPMLGRLAAPNLTSGRGGIGATFTDIDWVRAIRHGVGPDGKGLKIMPSGAYYTFSDNDLAAVIAYMKSLPPVDSDLPSTVIGPLGRALYLGGVLPLIRAEAIPHTAPRSAAPTPGSSAEYGRYIVTAGGCADCHGGQLSGGKVPGSDAATPPASNLTPGGELGAWTNEDLRRALREGKTPTGHQLSEEMPWKATSNLSNEEIDAIWHYLASLPARQYGE